VADDELGGRLVFHVRRTGIDEFAGGLVLVAARLKSHAEAGGVEAPLGIIARVGRIGIVEADRGVVLAHELIRGIFFDPGHDPLAALFVENALPFTAVGGGPKGSPAISAHVFWVEGVLRLVGGGTGHTGGFAGDGIVALGVGQVVVEGQPEAGARPGGRTGRGDAGLVEIPLLRLAADKLQSTRAIEHRALDRWHKAIFGGILEETVFHGHDGDAGGEGFLQHARDGAVVAVGPAAPVEEDQHGRGFVEFGFPEIHHLPGVRAVGVFLDLRDYDWGLRLLWARFMRHRFLRDGGSGRGRNVGG